MKIYRVTTYSAGPIYSSYVIESYSAAAALAFARAHTKPQQELLSICEITEAEKVPKIVKVRITEDRVTIQLIRRGEK